MRIPNVRQWAATKPTKGTDRLLVHDTVRGSAFNAWRALARKQITKGLLDEDDWQKFGPAMIEELKSKGFTVEHVLVGMT